MLYAGVVKYHLGNKDRDLQSPFREYLRLATFPASSVSAPTIMRPIGVER